METNAIQYNLEILKIAKELVENQYLDYRAKVHNKWLTDSEKLWETKQLKLDYPSFDAYPTEEDIVARAQILRDFLNSNPESSPNAVSSINNNETSSNVSITTNQVEDTAASQPKQTKKTKVPPPPEDNLSQWTRAKVNRYDEDEGTSFSRVVPELIKALNTPKIV